MENRLGVSDNHLPGQKPVKDGWKTSIMLPPGKHFYKFIIDGNEWITDPANELQERDSEGNVNSVLLIH